LPQGSQAGATMTDRDTPPEPTPGGGADDEKWPIGFLTIVILTALYLTFRLIQGVMWLIHRL